MKCIAPAEDPVPAVEKALAEVSRLATLPEITTRILAIVDDPQITADELERIVATDPVLSTRILKVVNSSFYGRRASVASVRQAIVILGTSGLKNVALAASMAKLFRGRSAHQDFDPRGLWRHAAAVAAAAKLIADRIGGDGHELFLIGLVHDIGMVVALQAFRSKFARLLDARRANCEEGYREAEIRILGATHEEFGLALCRKWNLPDEIQAAVGFHHDPAQLEGSSKRLAEIVCLADTLAAETAIGFCCAAGEPLPSYVLDDLGLSESELNRIRERLPEAAVLAEEMM